MIKYLYQVRVYNWDYFDQFRHNPRQDDVETFDNLLDAFKYYRKSKRHDYCESGSHIQITHRPKLVIQICDEPHIRHGYVRGHELNLLWDTIEEKYQHYKKYNYKVDDVEDVKDVDFIDFQKLFEEDDIVLD